MIERKDTRGLIACFGTWKDPHDETHVRKIHDAWRGQISKSISGVGTRFGIVGRWLGGMFGWGWSARVNEALEYIKENPDTISWSIVGHSRGGIIALRLSDRLRDHNIRVHNLILLDPVGSFGANAFIKTWIPPLTRQRFNIDYELSVPDNVRNIWALYAHDEERPHFRPTYLVRSSDSQKFFRCWFKGNHADIGGYGDKQTANFVGGLIRLVCNDDFGDSIEWPPEWLKYKPRHYTIDVIGPELSGLKRFLPSGSYLLLDDPHSMNNDDLTVIRKALSY